jgi:hypothetical protein
MQKVNTMGSDWPENGPDSFRNVLYKKRDIYFDNFLTDFNYKIVWENTAFAILEPQSKNK